MGKFIKIDCVILLINMALIPKIEIGEFSLVDTAIIVSAKIIGERLFSQMIGNGTVMSGVSKAAAASGIAMLSKGQKLPKMIATGLMVDATEDVLTAVNPLGLFAVPAQSGSADSRVRI